MALESAGSESEQFGIIQGFLADHPEFAGGAFDAETLTRLATSTLEEGMGYGGAALGEEQLLNECAEFFLSHWLVGDG